MARLKEKYRAEVVPVLMSEFGYHSIMQVPRVTKVTLNMGVGEAKTNAKLLDEAVEELALISRPAAVHHAGPQVHRRASSCARAWPSAVASRCAAIACTRCSTVCVSIALPRIRDFRGISPDQFDGRGNFAMGVREQIIFPEIDYDKVEHIRGLNIIITTTAKTDQEGRALLTRLGMPFRNELGVADAWQRNRLSSKAPASSATRRASTTAAHGAVGREATIVSSACAASACVSWLTRVSSPA